MEANIFLNAGLLPVWYQSAKVLFTSLYFRFITTKPEPRYLH
jgi:hypothetical protein